LKAEGLLKNKKYEHQNRASASHSERKELAQHVIAKAFNKWYQMFHGKRSFVLS
jgi:c-di-AMP phosphodiesterase-like protein